MRRFLFALSGNLPCRLIKHRGRAYLERYSLLKTERLTAYLHRFVSGDGDRGTHDHPWAWAFSVVLAGGYLELRVAWFDPERGPVTRFRSLGAGRVNFLGPRSFHKILKAEPETWTLFVHGPRVKGWGFLRSEPSDAAPVVYRGQMNQRHALGWATRSPAGAQIARAPLGVPA